MNVNQVATIIAAFRINNSFSFAHNNKYLELFGNIADANLNTTKAMPYFWTQKNGCYIHIQQPCKKIKICKNRFINTNCLNAANIQTIFLFANIRQEIFCCRLYCENLFSLVEQSILLRQAFRVFSLKCLNNSLLALSTYLQRQNHQANS